MLADVVEHAARFLDRLKGVVHAKLHGDDVKRLSKPSRRKCLRKGLSIAVYGSECRVKAWLAK